MRFGPPRAQKRARLGSTGPPRAVPGAPRAPRMYLKVRFCSSRGGPPTRPVGSGLFFMHPAAKAMHLGRYVGTSSLRAKGPWQPKGPDMSRFRLRRKSRGVPLAGWAALSKCRNGPRDKGDSHLCHVWVIGGSLGPVPNDPLPRAAGPAAPGAAARPHAWRACAPT